MVLQNAVETVSGKWLGLLILLILFIFLNYNDQSLFFAVKIDQGITIKDDFLRKEFPDMDSYRADEELIGWNQVLNKYGESLGFYIVSDNNRWNYSGYAGGVPLFIKLSVDKKISEIRMLENKETWRFLQKLYSGKFLQSWNGQSLSEASVSPIDSISGVTLTSNAIIANLSEVLELSEDKSPMGKVNYRLMLIRFAEFVIIVFGLFSFYISDLRKYRNLYLTAVIAVFGFTAGDFISLGTIQGFLTGAIPFYSNPILWMLFISSIIVPLFTNKALYCNYLCPFGAAQELIGKITPGKKRVHGNLKKVLNISRPLIFGCLAILIILDYKVDLSLVEPFAAFLYTVAAPFTILFALISLVLSIYFSKPWCRWFCPTGQFLEYFRSSD